MTFETYDTNTSSATAMLARGWTLFDGGRIDEARLCLARAFSADQQLISAALSNPVAARAHLAFEALGHMHPRISQLTRPSSWLGEAAHALSAMAEAMMTTRLAQASMAPAHPAFPDSDLPARDPATNTWPVPKLRVALVFEGDGTGNLSNNDLWFHYARSAAQCGLEIGSFDAAGLLYDRGQGHDLAKADHLFQSLSQAIGQFAPDIVMVEANFHPGPGRLDLRHLVQWQSRNFTLVFLVADTDETSAVPVDFWADQGDVLLYFNRSTLTIGAHHQHRLMRWPALPMVPATQMPVKDLNMVFVGRLYRGREVFAHYLKYFGLDPIIAGRNLHDAAPMNMANYMGALARAGLTFNTGIVNGTAGIVTGRLFEAIAERCLVLEELQAPMPNLFHPFVHFVPVANAHDAVIAAQYFTRYPDQAAHMAQAAYEFLFDHLPPERFWHALALRITNKDLPIHECP